MRSPPRELPAKLYCQYARTFLQDRRTFAPGDLTVVLILPGTRLLLVSPLLDSTGRQEWDDGLYEHRMRPTRSPPSRVSLSMLVVGAPLTLFPQTQAHPAPHEYPQGMLHVLQLKWHNVDACQSLAQAILAPASVSNNK